jgi:hypothetical protein
MLAFAAELDDHVGLSALMTFTPGFNPLLILAASFVNPLASSRIRSFDYVCGALSVAGTVAWTLARDADVALMAAIAANALLAALPTIRKASRR